MNLISRTYYQLTAYLPRGLPRNEAEYNKMLTVMQEAYDVPNDLPAFVTIAGHIGSQPSTKIRAPWGHIANAAKRLRVNEYAAQQKALGIAALKHKLEEAIKAEQERVQKEQGSGDTPSEVQPQANAVEDPAPSQERDALEAQRPSSED